MITANKTIVIPGTALLGQQVVGSDDDVDKVQIATGNTTTGAAADSVLDGTLIYIKVYN